MVCTTLGNQKNLSETAVEEKSLKNLMEFITISSECNNNKKLKGRLIQ